jgi:hypothetical protein
MSRVRSEWCRKRATEYVELRKVIEEVGDERLIGLMDERDTLYMNAEMANEIHAEWAEQARRFAPLSDGDRSCDCFSCAITRALNKAVGE